ncbi:hypothetical protein D4R52_01100 [bacterium]|nr:MAG: hypothetical protein D4R52_01100 [bacterium]
MKFRIVLLAVTLFAPLRLTHGQESKQCEEPGGLVFHWRHMAIRPVGPPLHTYQGLVQFVAPRVVEESGTKKELFDKPWQKVAAEKWGVTPDEFAMMSLAIQQGEGANFRRETIPLCTYINGDMMYDGAENELPKVLGAPLITEWVDGPKDAWTWQSENKKWYFFVGCSNPVFETKIVTPKVTAIPVPQIPETPQPKPEPEPPKPCPDCPPPLAMQVVKVARCPATDYQFFASAFSRSPLGILTPRNIVEFIASMGGGVGMSAGLSDKGARSTPMLQGLAFSGGAYVIANLINPDDDRVRVKINKQNYVLKRGQEKKFSLPSGDSGKAVWKGRYARVFLDNEDGSRAQCSVAKVGNNVNFTPVGVTKHVVTQTVIEEKCFVLVDGQVKPCGTAGARPQ